MPAPAIPAAASRRVATARRLHYRTARHVVTLLRNTAMRPEDEALGQLQGPTETVENVKCLFGTRPVAIPTVGHFGERMVPTDAYEVQFPIDQTDRPLPDENDRLVLGELAYQVQRVVPLTTTSPTYNVLVAPTGPYVPES